jgi:hypothetical protein
VNGNCISDVLLVNRVQTAAEQSELLVKCGLQSSTAFVDRTGDQRLSAMQGVINKMPVEFQRNLGSVLSLLDISVQTNGA